MWRASVSKTTYSNLFAIIGTQFGGDTNTFNIPNYKGAFLRGADASSIARNVGPLLNVSQVDAIQNHTHHIVLPPVVTELSIDMTSADPAGNRSVVRNVYSKIEIPYDPSRIYSHR